MTFNDSQKDASEYTKRKHDEILKEMDSEQCRIEKEDLEDVRAHFILELGADDFKDESGNVIWNRKEQTRLTSMDYPDTVNPYLWNIYRDGYPAGVLKAKEGFYIVIGIDSSAIAFIKSKTGWIIQDCCNTLPAAEISMKLVEEASHVNIHDNVRAVIYSHTHTDHLGGIGAFVKDGEEGSIEEGKIPVIAPKEFEQSLIDDNLYAGVAMSRRLQYQCGLFLKPDEKGRVSIGLSSTLGIRGEISSLMPTMFIEKDGEVEIDGVRLTFILTPHTETRAHMCTYFNDYKVLFLGDNSVGTLHNTYTMRGAPVRDANYWGKVFYHLYNLFGEEVEVVYQGHGLPHFKMKDRPDNLKKFLLDNAVSYKFTHDRALHLANKGYSIHEIPHALNIPDSIKRTWYTRGHYGEYTFNARGTIQKYLGFYDGNPVHLMPLSEREMAKKLIEYMGDEKTVLKKAVEDFEKGNYQWVATIASHLVYNNPENKDARYLCADAFEQLGYQTENALWRNAYLAGALDLRHPEFSKGLSLRAMNNSEVIPHVYVELLLDYLGINFDGLAGEGLSRKFVLKVLTGDGEEEFHSVEIYKGTILHEKLDGTGTACENAVTLTKDELYMIAAGTYPEEKKAGLPKEVAEISNYVTDMEKYRNFSLIEPL